MKSGHEIARIRAAGRARGGAPATPSPPTAAGAPPRLGHRLGKRLITVYLVGRKPGGATPSRLPAPAATEPCDPGVRANRAAVRRVAFGDRPARRAWEDRSGPPREPEAGLAEA